MGTQFAILRCGHWIADPDKRLQMGQHGPCPVEHGRSILVIATPYDPIVHLIKDGES